MGMSRAALVLIALMPFALAGCGSHSPDESCQSCVPVDDDVEAPATSTSVVRGFAPIADTFIVSTMPTTNYGDWPVLKVAHQGSAEEYWTLIAFDLTALPTDSVVNKATLLLYVDDYYSQDELTLPCEVHRATNRWSEMTATWNTHFTFFAPGPVATTETSAASIGSMVRFNITRLVKNWVKYPARNSGCMIKGPADFTGSARVEFGSRENEAPAKRPRLRVDYSPPA
jgi:hypothetical protein